MTFQIRRRHVHLDVFTFHVDGTISPVSRISHWDPANNLRREIHGTDFSFMFGEKKIVGRLLSDTAWR